MVLCAILTSQGCAKSPPAEGGGAPSAGSEAASECGSSAPSTPAHCECLGGYVRGDIGDGNVSCPQGETMLERVNSGIEGAVCCRALVP